MKLYTIYIKKANNTLSDIACVPEEFSWLATFFCFPWLLVHKLWIESLIIMILILAVISGLPAEVVNLKSQIILFLGVAVYTGVTGNYMRQKYLQRNGYQLMDIILATSEEEAATKYLKEVMSLQNEI